MNANQGQPVALPGPAVLARFLARAVPGLPRYAQLRDSLLAAIERGYWAPGAKLPTEQELARATPFSLGTVQRALRALVEEGIVVRTQGSGTFVAESRRPMDQPWHCRFLDDEGRAFLPVYTKVVGRRRIREPGPWSAHLVPGGGEVIGIDRVISVNDEFLVFSRFYLDAERFPTMLTRPATELDGANLKLIISREFGLPVTRVAQTLSAARFPEFVRRALKLRRGVTGTLLEVAASAGRDRPLYYQELYIPPNRRRLVISDTVPSHGGATASLPK
jgi:GntR family transcriptional regulator